MAALRLKEMATAEKKMTISQQTKLTRTFRFVCLFVCFCRPLCTKSPQHAARKNCSSAAPAIWCRVDSSTCFSNTPRDRRATSDWIHRPPDDDTKNGKTKPLYTKSSHRRPPCPSFMIFPAPQIFPRLLCKALSYTKKKQNKRNPKTFPRPPPTPKHFKRKHKVLSITRNKKCNKKKNTHKEINLKTMGRRRDRDCTAMGERTNE